MAALAAGPTPAQLRWDLADVPRASLFEPLRREVGRGEYRGMEFLEVEAASVLNEVRGRGPGQPGGLPFRWSLNPYRGCVHACTYCFARPTHTYLGLDAGRDFDRRIVVKINAVERLRAELHPSRWQGELVALGTNTDPYQRGEGKYRLTRRIIRTFLEFGNPFSILTKSTLILRDIDLLRAAAAAGLVQVSLSIGTVDDTVWRATEPGTPPPNRRLRAVERLRDAGIPCGVLIAPILPGVSDCDDQLEAVAQAVVAAGASSIGHVVLHLRHEATRAAYLEALRRSHPEAAEATERRHRGGVAPRADRDRIAAVLGAAVRAAGGRLGPPTLPGAPDLAGVPTGVGIRRPSGRAAVAAVDQLRLPLA